MPVKSRDQFEIVFNTFGGYLRKISYKIETLSVEENLGEQSNLFMEEPNNLELEEEIEIPEITC